MMILASVSGLAWQKVAGNICKSRLQIVISWTWVLSAVGLQFLLPIKAYLSSRWLKISRLVFIGPRTRNKIISCLETRIFGHRVAATTIVHPRMIIVLELLIVLNKYFCTPGPGLFIELGSLSLEPITPDFRDLAKGDSYDPGPGTGLISYLSLAALSLKP